MRPLTHLTLALALAGGLQFPVLAGTPALLVIVPVIEAEGFNRDALNGALAFQRLHGASVTLVTPEGSLPTPPQITALLERTAATGADPVVAVGYYFRDALAVVAPKFPTTRFILMDAIAVAPNVLNVIFREEEGSFLAGALAALSSRSGSVGFVGGMDISVIRNFGCGYAHGAHHVKPKTRVLSRMNRVTIQAFTDRAAAARQATELIDLGADVIFHAAGDAGIGVIEAARQRGVLAIGVDVNQNAIAPGTVLTSMLKRLDVAVYLVLREAQEGRWRAGTRQLGLRENAVGVVLDRHNILLLDDVKHARLGDLQFAIIDKSLAVHRYDREKDCPYLEFPAPPPGAPQ